MRDQPAKPLRGPRELLAAVGRDPVSAVGAALATAAGTVLVTLLVLEAAGLESGAYLGLLTLGVLPLLLVLGLVLIPIGLARGRRRAARALAEGRDLPTFPVLDFNLPRIRSLALVFVLLTVVNVVLLSAATYKGVHAMESNAFCGTACHTPMEPEGTAHPRFAHANVDCVDCHVGSGAGSFVKAKLNGMTQLWEVAVNSYPRPIPTPAHGLANAERMCGECHAGTTFDEDKLKVIRKYGDDEANTPATTVLVLQKAIHWHARKDVAIRYQTDAKREKVGAIEVTHPDGRVERFEAPEGSELAGFEWRAMNCMDCHNRPAHTFASAEEELFAALTRGDVARDLPYARREGLRLLTAEYRDRADAEKRIPAELAAFYAADYAELAVEKKAEIDRAGRALAEMWAANVFPAMKVGWGTYPNHLGHERFPGCFRCHDDEHATAEGKTVSQDCAHCHAMPAMDEEDPEILKQLAP